MNFKFIIKIVSLVAIVFILLYFHIGFSNNINKVPEDFSFHFFVSFEKNKNPDTPDFVELAEIDSTHLTNEKAYHGEYSLHISDKTAFYNIGQIVINEKKDQFYSLSFVCNSDAYPHLVAENEDGFYNMSKIVRSFGDWKLLTTDFFIPPNLTRDTLNIYIWNVKRNEIWLDSISFTCSPNPTYPSFDSLSFMHLLINNEPMYKLKEFREIAYMNGIEAFYSVNY